MPASAAQNISETYTMSKSSQVKSRVKRPIHTYIISYIEASIYTGVLHIHHYGHRPTTPPHPTHTTNQSSKTAHTNTNTAFPASIHFQKHMDTVAASTDVSCIFKVDPDFDNVLRLWAAAKQVGV